MLTELEGISRTDKLFHVFFIGLKYIELSFLYKTSEAPSMPFRIKYKNPFKHDKCPTVTAAVMRILESINDPI